MLAAVVLALVPLGAGAQETPLPTPVPVVAPSASPEPSPSAPPPLRLDRQALTVGPGGIGFVGIISGRGPYAISVDGPSVTARFDAVTTSVVVTGRSLGAASVTVTDALGNTANVSVAVLPYAGNVPAEVTVTLGGTVSSDFAQTRIQAEMNRLAQVQPGASIAIRGVTLPPTLHQGDAAEAVASVTISGATYANVSGQTAVHLRVETLDELDPAFLFYSDDPERLAASADGVLFRDTIDPAKSARVYAYHVSDAPGRRVFLTLNASGAPAHVQILGAVAGPTDAFAYVGHVSTLRYLLERSTQESAIVGVASGSPYLQQLGYKPLDAGELIAAILDLRVVDGGTVDVAVVSVPAGGDPVALLGGSEIVGDGHGRRGTFSLSGIEPLALSFAAGATDPQPFTVGDPTIPNLRPGGRALGGDYGVLRAVTLALSNPAATPQAVYLYEEPVGGASTTTIWFTGDPAPTEMPCVKGSTNRYLVKTFTLDAGETRTVTGEYMTDGSASFPLEFGLTSTAPSPAPGPYSPDTCNPKPAPPSPSPSPTSEPVPGPASSATPGATATP